MIKRGGLGAIATLQQIFDRNREFFKLVKVNRVEVAADGSSYKAECETAEDGLECFVNFSFNGDLESQCMPGDVWLCAFVNGDLNQGFLLQRIHNMTAPLHPKSRGGDTVLGSRPKKKIHLSNDHEATLMNSAVLGPELVAWLLKLSSEVKGLADKINSLVTWAAAHTHVSAAPASPTTPPAPPPTTTAAPEKLAVTALEATTETDKFLSDLVFIQEKGLKNSP